MSKLVSAAAIALAVAACASGTVDFDAGDAPPNPDAGDDVTPIDAASPIDAIPAGDPGAACGSDAECSTGHCENGFCCATGVCCATDDNCDAYDVSPICNSTSTCQGRRTDGVCNETYECTEVPVDDDSGCAGNESNDCGLYPSVICTAEVDQPMDQPALCLGSCTLDTECDLGSHCDGSACTPDLGVGEFCDELSDCTSGLFCIDNVCCTSDCSGTCRACDVAGSLGVCANIPDGTDPDLECAGVGCAGFYAGWSGDTCRRKADVSDAQATCGGDAMCRSQAEECNAQSATTAFLTCGVDDMPDLATCTGSTAGMCVPIPCGTVEDFEGGVWPAAGWTAGAAATGGAVSGSYAHDGAYGVRDPDWYYNTSTTALVSTGDTLSAWVRHGAGRVYIGFDASASGAKSFVLAPNTGDIRFQDNNGYSYTELNSVAFSHSTGTWYYVEIEHMGGNAVQGRVYASNGTTLLGTVNQTYGSRSPGGVAIRSFSGHDIDTIVRCNY